MDQTWCDFDGRTLSPLDCHTAHGQMTHHIVRTATRLFHSMMELLGLDFNPALDWDLAGYRVTTQAKKIYSRFADPESSGVDTMFSRPGGLKSCNDWHSSPSNW